MKNIPEVKLGILAGTTDWMPSDIAAENRKKLVEIYKAKFGEENIYECPIVLGDNEVNIKRAMREIVKEQCNAVCIYWANYGPESAGTLFADEFDGPVMLVAAAEEGEGPYTVGRRDALSGFINACYALKLRNTNVYIPETPYGTMEQCADMISEYMAIARTMIAVKDLKLMMIGPRPASYLAVNAPNHLLYDIGVEVSEYSELELYDSFKKHEGDKRIEKTVTDMQEELDEIKTPGILHELARYELTIEDWIRNHKGNRKFVTVTSTCWPAFPVSFGFVPCYVNSRLTAKGIPVACEVDAYGALSEYIGQCISNDTVTILNINNSIPYGFYEDKIKGKSFNGRSYDCGDLFLGYHCGVTPSCRLNNTSLDYHFVNRQLIGEKGAEGTVQGNLKPGEVTLFRIQGTRDNKLRAYVCQGQILPVEMDTYGGRAVIAIPQMERFIRNVVLEKQFPNHCAVLFGHFGKKLVSVLRGLGITEMDYNHPKEIPYEKENVFHSLTEWY